MSQSLSPRQDPSTCNHLWNLALYTTGRRVALECSRCRTTDKEVWGPGGIADLVSMEFDVYGTLPPDDMSDPPVTRVKVDAGRHTSDRERLLPVDLTVVQSARISGYRSGTQVSLSTDTRVEATLRTNPF